MLPPLNPKEGTIIIYEGKGPIDPSHHPVFNEDGWKFCKSGGWRHIKSDVIDKK